MKTLWTVGIVVEHSRTISGTHADALAAKEQMIRELGISYPPIEDDTRPINIASEVTDQWVEVAFSGKDPGEFVFLWLPYIRTKYGVRLYEIEDGGGWDLVTTGATTHVPGATLGSPLWARIVVDPDDGSSEYIKVYLATTEAGLDSAMACLVYSGSAVDLTGGCGGFGRGDYVDDVTIEIDDGEDGWTTESYDAFDLSGSGRWPPQDYPPAVARGWAGGCAAEGLPARRRRACGCSWEDPQTWPADPARQPQASALQACAGRGTGILPVSIVALGTKDLHGHDGRATHGQDAHATTRGRLDSSRRDEGQ